MIIHDVAQRSPEWYALRCGRLTGSCAADMTAHIKTGEAAARRDLRTRLVVERLTGVAESSGYQSAEMKWGIEHEREACHAYEALTGELISPVGFVAHDELLAGCSPDGQIGGFRGLVEIKCPKSATHLKYLRARTVPTEYLPQVHHNLWLTGAERCDFVSFDPRFPAALRLIVTRVTMAEAQRRAYELLVRMFLVEVEREVEEVRAMLTGVAA